MGAPETSPAVKKVKDRSSIILRASLCYELHYPSYTCYLTHNCVIAREAEAEAASNRNVSPQYFVAGIF